jgi:hypothetical protein
MKTTVRILLPCALAMMAVAAEKPPVRPYEAASFSTAESGIDRIVFEAQRKAGIQAAAPCSDEVFVRRAYLDVIGLPPTAAEARAFFADKHSDKRARLIDQLLERPEYTDYWTMRWCDLLRVKSEFPINLWPNAVQAYQKWIRDCVRDNLPLDGMARAMITASGSNFRVPQVNFLRAVRGRGPQPLAAAVALTLMGSRIESWPADRRAGMETFFSRVAYKATAEWKEEIVCLDPAPAGPLEAMLPDGRSVRVPPGQDPRAVFAEWLLAPGNRWFARAAVNRHWAWIFGRGIVHEPDDIRPDNPPSVPGLLDHLEKEFTRSGYDPKALLRLILNSRVYQLSPVPRSDHPQAAAMFASYPVRRLDAEVLLDAICVLTDTAEGYDSPIPEPFTHVPASARSVNLADASITSPFLEMFGRSPRDSGRVMERSNTISDAQRLHLLNSSQIRGKIERSEKLRALTQGKRRDAEAVIHDVWMTVLSRPPTLDERQEALAHLRGAGSGVKQAVDDVIWALVNSKEFLFRH